MFYLIIVIFMTFVFSLCFVVFFLFFFLYLMDLPCISLCAMYPCLHWQSEKITMAK